MRSLELINERNEAELASLGAALEKANEARAADRRAFESDLAGFQAEAERATATFRAVEADNTAQRAAQTEEYARQQAALHARLEASQKKLTDALAELDDVRAASASAERASIAERAAAAEELRRSEEALGAATLAAAEREAALKRDVAAKGAEIAALKREAISSAEDHVTKTNALIAVRRAHFFFVVHLCCLRAVSRAAFLHARPRWTRSLGVCARCAPVPRRVHVAITRRLTFALSPPAHTRSPPSSPLCLRPPLAGRPRSARGLH